MNDPKKAKKLLEDLQKKRSKLSREHQEKLAQIEQAYRFSGSSDFFLMNQLTQLNLLSLSLDSSPSHDHHSGSTGGYEPSHHHSPPSHHDHGHSHSSFDSGSHHSHDSGDFGGGGSDFGGGGGDSGGGF